MNLPTKLALSSLCLLLIPGCFETPKNTTETVPAPTSPAPSSGTSTPETVASDLAESEEVIYDDAPNYLQEALDAPKPDPYDIQKTTLADFFNASPETVATLLGAPLDSSDNSPESDSLDYSPTSFEPFFPDPTFFKSLSVRYDQGKAVSINLYLRRPMPTLNDEEISPLELTTMFAAGLFTDPTPTYQEVYSAHPGESLQYSHYCVADGVATSVIDGQFYDLNFFREPDCEG